MRKTNLKSVEDSQEELGSDIQDDENEEIDEAGRPIKESKLNNLLSFLKDYSEDYEIWLYKKGERNKRFLITKFDNYIPDPFTDIQQKFGGGEYRFMVCSNNKMIDTADFNLMELNAANASTASIAGGAFPGSSRSDMLNELKIMSEMFRAEPQTGKNDSNIMLEITKMQLEQARHMAEQQQKSEARITALIMEMNSKKPALSEIMEVVQFVDDLKGGAAASGEASLLEKIITSPAASPFIEKILSGFTASSVTAPTPAAIAQPVQIPEPVKKLTAADYVSKIPVEFKQQVTEENKLSMINFVYEKNKNMIAFATAENIINLIVQENLQNVSD